MNKISHTIVGQNDVDVFLSEVYNAIQEGRCIVDKRKPKHKNTLTALGLCCSDVIDEISSLTYADYLSGPDPDNRDNHQGQFVWVFKKRVDGFLVYIKLEFQTITYNRQADEQLVVMSFHFDNN